MSITANAVTSRHTNDTETNQRPAYFVHCTVLAHMDPHVQKHVCTPTEQTACTHMSACTSNNKRCFMNAFCFKLGFFFLLFRAGSYAGERIDFSRGNFNPNLQARFCKLYPADFVGWIWVIQMNSSFPKNGNKASLYLYTMLGECFRMGRSAKSPRAWRCRKRARPCLKNPRGGF